MHPAPNLIEAPPFEEKRSPAAPTGGPGGAQQSSPHSPHTPIQPVSPPLRKDTNSSISTQATTATSTTETTSLSVETNNTSYSAETSPNPHQSIFSVTDGTDLSNTRRPCRRRTGPLSQHQREKAALIRKLGACADCRRRRVACHPNHHNMTWEDAVKKYHRSHSPTTIQDIAPLAGGRPLSPASSKTNHVKPIFNRDPEEMEIDSVPPHPPRQPMNEARIRTPLPSGPRLEKVTTPPGIDAIKSDVQSIVSKVLSTPHRSRYSAVYALLLYWQDDDDGDVPDVVEGLADVLGKQYQYTFQIEEIPSSSDGSKSSYRWLSRTINELADTRDDRDVLKIVYYNGHSYLDGNREMVLASSQDRQRASTIRWHGIQQILEEACSDTLIVMDAAYYPSGRMVRERGVLELVAASASEEAFRALGRSTFTRALTEQLHNRTARGSRPFSATEINSKVLSVYLKLTQEVLSGRDATTSFSPPLYMQMSVSNSRLPSILLAPLHQVNGVAFAGEQTSPQLQLCIRFSESQFNAETWEEWLRSMPDGIKDVKVDGPLLRPYR